MSRYLMQVTPVVLGGILIASSAAFAAGQGPCEQIVQACSSAGFIKGEFKEKKGLWRDCVDPIVQGKTVQTAIPLPTVDPSVVSACRAKHPKFGEGKVGG
jgi:hypothetical protein